jgi:hypothetical protein
MTHHDDSSTPDDGAPLDDFDEASLATVVAEPLSVRRSIVQTLLLVASANDGISAEEARGLSLIAGAFGFGQAEIDALLPRGDIVLEEFPVEVSSVEGVCRAWLSMLIEMAGLDGEVTPMALNVIGYVGGRLGFTGELVASRIHTILGLDVQAVSDELGAGPG